MQGWKRKLRGRRPDALQLQRKIIAEEPDQCRRGGPSPRLERGLQQREAGAGELEHPAGCRDPRQEPDAEMTASGRLKR